MDDVEDRGNTDRPNKAIMDYFISENHDLSVEIIVNRFGNLGVTGNTYNVVRQGYDAGLFELGIHGFDHVRHSQLTKDKQSADFASAKSKLISLMDDPNLRLFVPPFNDFDSDTIKAMAENELDIISSSYSSERTSNNIYKTSNSFETDNSIIQLSEVTVLGEDSSQNIKRRVYHIPFDVSVSSMIEPKGSLSEQSLVDSVMSKASTQITNTGFAVIVLHPQDIAPYNSATGGWSNGISQSKFQTLQDIVSAVEAEGYTFVHMSDVAPEPFSEPIQGASTHAALTLNAIANVGWEVPVTVTGKLADADTGEGIENAEITFDNTGAENLSATTTGPDGTFTAKGLAPSTVATGWKVQAHFAGGSNYQAAHSLVKTYNTVAHSVSISVSTPKSSVPWGAATSFTATVVDTTAGVPSGTFVEAVPVTLDGTGVIGVTSPVESGPDGKAVFTGGTAPDTVAPGWAYQAHFTGDSLYKKKDSIIRSYSTIKHSVSLSLAVTKSGDAVGTSSTTVEPGASYRVSGTLTDSTAKVPLSSKTISFIADEPITILDKVTNTNGFYASWQASPNTDGIYSIQSRFAGDDLYNSRDSVVRTLTVAGETLSETQVEEELSASSSSTTTTSRESPQLEEEDEEREERQVDDEDDNDNGDDLHGDTSSEREPDEEDGSDTATTSTTADDVDDSTATTTTPSDDSDDETVLTADNNSPIADAGPDNEVSEGTEDFSLNGTGSSDPDGDEIVKYIWKQIAGPDIRIDTRSEPGYAIFDVPSVEEDTELKFRLQVEDSNGDRSESGDRVTVTVINGESNKEESD